MQGKTTAKLGIDSDPTKQQQHQDHDDDDAKDAGGPISPSAAVAPIRKRTNKKKNQYYEQYGSYGHENLRFSQPLQQIVRDTKVPSTSASRTLVGAGGGRSACHQTNSFAVKCYADGGPDGNFLASSK